MNLEIQSLRRAEAATLRLRGLYESYGYRKYRMGRFEEYSLYAANKSFLLGENVPTFTDLDGRLMALKPDVTLSIAKNTKADKNTCEKVYYLESVYRESKESHTYKEISQMGLECMGGVDDCVIAEVLALALKSLADFETDYVLKISNMDFVVGLMEELPVNADQKDIILGLIRTKNRSGLEKLCADLALSEGDTEKLMKVSGLYGEFGRVLAEAGAIADTPKMKEAVALLSRLYAVLEAMGLGGQLDKVRLDFSMINDIEYYNGIIFQGFLDGLARQVLSGGQYDGMMAKLGKKADAIGFAIYLKELERLPEKSIRYDVDALVLYEPDVDVVRLCQAVESLRRQGLTGGTVTLKLKYSYGSGRSAQRRLPHPTDDENIFVAVALELLDNIWQEGMHVRLAGIGMSDFDHQGGIQTDLFCEVDDRGAQSSDRRDLSVAIDAVRDKFGDTALSFGRQSRFND